MKVKFSELTIKQVTDICKRMDRENCPFRDSDLLCNAAALLIWTELDKEIDLPDEEVKDDA